jgi:hypothetical protein
MGLAGFLFCLSYLFAADNHKPSIDIRMEGEILATGGDSDITFRFRMPGTNDASLIRYQYKLDGREATRTKRIARPMLYNLSDSTVSAESAR